MPLTQASAARKDRNAPLDVRLEHRHFAFITATLAGMKPHGINTHESREWLRAVVAFADACATTNPRFDRARFLRACGVAS